MRKILFITMLSLFALWGRAQEKVMNVVKTGNTAPVTDATITAVNARYVRVNVTDGGSDGHVRFADIEVYGSH